MVAVLGALCVLFSVLTWREQPVEGGGGGAALARDVVAEFGDEGVRVLVVSRKGGDDGAFVAAFERGVGASKVEVLRVVSGTPRDAKLAVEELDPEVVACPPGVAAWPVFSGVAEKVRTTRAGYGASFLKAENLLNIASQISVIAILAIGMTMVIITAGIDLSVGSLIALSAVVTTWLIQRWGGESAGMGMMLVACLGGVLVCGCAGLFTGTMVSRFTMPPFIVTLGMMLMARGLSYTIAGGETIYQVPDGFTWLGRAALVGGIPVSVVLMVLLYAVAHVLMGHTALGRYVYAVGGNAEAARLSGVAVKRIKLMVYTVCGALAGLGGVVMASQLKSGSGTYGQMYELYVIAAVVVGGTSLFGGKGKIIGTLIGAFIIAVIRNGMNLLNMNEFTQNIVLGGVILVAVLLERLKSGEWRSEVGG